MLCHEILLCANTRLPNKIDCRRRALINGEGCDLRCTPMSIVPGAMQREQPEHLFLKMLHSNLVHRFNSVLSITVMAVDREYTQLYSYFY